MTSAAAPPSSEKKSFERRDRLLQIQTEAQRLWEENHSFEKDAPKEGEPDQEKFLVVFPYPYTNGSLHLGHAFTLSKAEFAAGYQRLKGKRVLFPFGFHCTGMPIAACALKLEREIKMYGNPPQFPDAIEDEAEESSSQQKGKSKKGKIAKKKSKEVYQWNILLELGVPEDQVASFADPLTWLKYFPPLARDHLKIFGLKADFRRSFITTEVNPFYDRFIQWQFNILRARDKLAFGNRLSVFSPIDNQPCADHDRASGEGVVPQEFCAIKMKLLGPYPSSFAPLEGRDVFLLAATLRPETMYGQTNCWVLPKAQYVAVQALHNQVYVCSERAALNMSYQNLLPEFGKIEILAKISGDELIGCALSSPNCTFDKIYLLPLLTISMSKGTGIVTSVPSDAPDDYIALEDLRGNANMRAKYNLLDEMVLPFEPVPIVDVPGFGNIAAAKACKDLKIQNQHDRKKLDIAKEQVYTAGFYKGVMLVGDCAGKTVIEAKPLVRQQMVDAGQAFMYSEPEKTVMSRSGNECVAALTDQWFLKYGEAEWMKMVRDHVENRLETYSEFTRKRFLETVDWLREWACSRSFGLGTKLPWDPQFVIESLSDSTIYMAYYTISHLCQGGVIDGSKPGPAAVPASAFSDEVLNFIFLGADMPKQTELSEEMLITLRREFSYWYPVDLRVSGKDLINNHLTMALYNHAAVWPDEPEKWPQSYFTNGHAMLNGDKMSKSTGNFITLEKACATYTSDATRLALADAGDGLDDANVSLATTANAGILRLTREEDWITTVLAGVFVRTDDEMLLVDKIFENEINQAIILTDGHYANMQFRAGLKSGFWDLIASRDKYRAQTEGVGMHRALIYRFIEVMTVLLSPICPHICEHIWKKIGKSGLVVDAEWPEAAPIDHVLKEMSLYIDNVSHAINSKYHTALTKAKKGNAAVTQLDTVKLLVAAEYPEWQNLSLQLLRQLYESNPDSLQDRALVSSTFKACAELKRHLKNAMKFAFSVIAEVEVRGGHALQATLAFDELSFLRENSQLLVRGLPLDTVDIEVAEVGVATPGKPGVRISCSSQ